MDEPLPSFFEGRDDSKHFHQVIALHEKPSMDWDAVSTLVPTLPRGWYELSQLPVEDRIEFTYSFWQSKLLFSPAVESKVEKCLEDFFSTLEDVGIFVAQVKKDGPFDVHMVYSLKDEAGYFQGYPPASIETIASFAKRLSHVNFPLDYLAFMEIHDGFSKYTDTGIIKTKEMVPIYQRLQRLLSHEFLVRPDGQLINPESLIPFYESFGLHCYQCFYAEWYPGDEMGNVYFSEPERSISNFLDPDGGEGTLAFSSFLEWLVFYLEDIWHL